MTTEISRILGWLHPKAITPIPGGWTYETYSVDDTWICQVARTNYATNMLRHQLRVLPRLGQYLGDKIPTMQLASEGPTTIVYKRFAGVHADAAAPDGPWPEQLGAVVARLHAIAPRTLGLPDLDPEILRDDARAECQKLLGVVGPRLAIADRARAETLIADHTETASNWHFKPAPIHGDLDPENVIISPAGELAGVLDWEHLGAGDPAWDFGYWLNAQPAIGKRMLETYGGAPDDTFHRRARTAYALVPWYAVRHGVDTGQDALVESGLAGVRARLP